MKKVTVLIMAILYFTISSGLIVNFHYCMDRFTSFDFNAVAKNECGLCGMDKTKSKGCCHDEVKLIKLQDVQNKTVQVAYDFTSVQYVATITSQFIIASFYNTNEEKDQIDHSPPLLSRQDLQIKNCVFRI
jgi:hypothetical protein